jgi:hypothetical protein
MSLRGNAHSGVNGAVDVDLGELKPGGVDPLIEIFVQSTGGYQLTAQSENNGYLKLEDDANWLVPYSMALDGNIVPFSGPGLSVADAPDAHQDHIKMSFVIGDASRHRAGVYRDTITLTIEPL